VLTLSALPLAWMITCPLGGELADLPSPPAATTPGPADLPAELASVRADVLPSTLLGPLDLGARGAIALGIRCAGTASRPRAPCDLVVAHLAPVDGALVLSGVVETFPVQARGRAPSDYEVTGVALRDLVGDATPELVVRWRVGDATWIGALAWLGFGRLFGPEPLVEPDCPDATLTLACGAGPTAGVGRPELTRACGGAARQTWRWDGRGARFVKRR